MITIDCPRLFVLQRIVDESGISGTGRVADGVLWTDGTVCMRWRTHTRSVSFYDSLNDVINIHGHNGKTQVKFLDLKLDQALAEIAAVAQEA
jgi:hypothetical protein